MTSSTTSLDGRRAARCSQSALIQGNRLSLNIPTLLFLLNRLLLALLGYLNLLGPSSF